MRRFDYDGAPGKPMQRIDEQKRLRIIETASRLLSEKPFRDVRLEDIAAEANIGKGTIYVYFKSKTDLCISLFMENMVRTNSELKSQLEDTGLTCPEKVDRILHTLLTFSRHQANFPTIVRELSLTQEDLRPLWAKRQEMLATIEAVLQGGVSAGQVSDPAPMLTARLLLAVVREYTFHPMPDVDQEALVCHMNHILTNGIFVKGSA
jgi:AcrR family transcriptional regulator